MVVQWLVLSSITAVAPCSLPGWGTKILQPAQHMCESCSAAAAAKSLQSCPTLCNPIDGSPVGSPVPGILQARVLEWGAIAFSGESRSVESDSLRPHELQPFRLLCPLDFPGRSTGVGCHFLLQGIFLTQGSNPSLAHCRQTL